MTDLETHITVFKNLRMRHRNALIRMIFHIAREHPEINAEDFIKQISQKSTTTNIVEPLKKE